MEPGLMDDYIAGSCITAIRALVSSQLRLAGWPALKRLSEEEQCLRHAEPDQRRMERKDVLQLRQILCMYRFPRQHHRISIRSLVVSTDSALEDMAAMEGELGNCNALDHVQGCEKVAGRFEHELYAASWPLLPDNSSVRIGRMLMLDAAEATCEVAEQSFTMPASPQSMSPAADSAERSSSPDVSVSKEEAPTEAASRSKATSAQATRCLAKRRTGASQASLGVSCPSPEDIRRAEEAARLLIANEQAAKVAMANKAAKAKARKQQRRQMQGQPVIQASHPQASMPPEAEHQGIFLTPDCCIQCRA